MDLADEIAEAVIATLLDRPGFGAWWGNLIDAGQRAEAVSDIATAVRALLRDA